MQSDLAVVCWLWDDGNRAYKPEHVRVLARMTARHLAGHRFVCVTNMHGEFGPGVDVMPIPESARALCSLKTLEKPNFPSCYRRLWMFSDEAQSIAERVLLFDIDLIVTKSLEPIVDRAEDFVGWRPRASWNGRDRLGGGMYLLRTGTRLKVWEDFDATTSPAIARAAGFRGSDQAWISYCLWGKEAMWSDNEGLYSIRDIKRGVRAMPSDAKVVQFNGNCKPWDAAAPKWAKEAWC